MREEISNRGALRAGRLVKVDDPFLGRHEDSACRQELRDRSPVEVVFSLAVRLDHSAALNDARRSVLSAPLVDNGKSRHGERY
jgi:hypothetical protein